MNDDDLRDDPLLRTLAGLPGEDLDPRRSARLRARCHAELARRGPVAGVSATPLGLFMRTVLEPAVVAAVSIVVLAEVGRRAAMIFGL